jgi:hypothetical protein
MTNSPQLSGYVGFTAKGGAKKYFWASSISFSFFKVEVERTLAKRN